MNIMPDVMTSQVFLSVVSGICISAVAAYLGTLMLSKKMTVVAGPLAHLALPGVALAILYGFEISFGVFPFLLAGAVLIWLLERQTKLPIENLAAIIFAFGVGSALLILPIGRAEAALIGNIGAITLAETIAVVLLSAVVAFLVRSLYQRMMLANIHEELAQVEGSNVGFLNLLYLLCIAVIVGLGVYLVGGLITAALIAVPAASARNVSTDLVSYKRSAVVLGVLATLGGILLAPLFSVPIGPAIIVIDTFVFLVTVLVRRGKVL